MGAAKSGDQVVKCGEVFVKCTEKTGLPRLGFSGQGEIAAWTSQRRLPEKKTALRKSRDGGWVYNYRRLAAKTERLVDMTDAQQQFKLEEFRQLHEHIRNFESALSSIFTVSLPASVTLLTAITVWFFKTEYSTVPGPVKLALCYLFLSPALLSLLTLDLISSYKTSVYRNGYYIKVFFEEAGAGAHWHLDLVEYRKLGRVRDEHGTPASYMLWAVFGISIGLFVLALMLTGSSLAHLAALLPLGVAMAIQQERFVSDREKIEEAWHEVQRREASGPPAVP